MDEAVWNPETDPHIVRNYSPSDLSGKAECRNNLLKEAGLDPTNDRPVVAIISRLALQKGMDLLEAGVERILNLDIDLFVLGSGGSRYEEFFRDLQASHPDRVYVAIRFDGEYAHRLQAGADMLLMPSRYEPCGFHQMNAMKYGTVPIVRATGGLHDTVQEWDPETKKGTGFKFEPYDVDALIEAATRAREAFRDQGSWTELMVNCMQADFSWKNAALIYMSLYDQAIQLKS
jgi:starch synthase